MPSSAPPCANLLEENEVDVVGEACTGEEAVNEALRTYPDVVVMDVRMPGMDVRMPGMDGSEASRTITSQLPETHVVMVSGMGDDEEQLIRAIDAGARSYITKDEDPQTFVEAVRKVQQEGSFLSPYAAQLLVRHLSRRSRPQPNPEESAVVSEREKDVLRLIAEGHRNHQIAQQLHISDRSVGNHLAKIYTKLHIHSRSESVLYAIKAGIASVE